MLAWRQGESERKKQSDREGSLIKEKNLKVQQNTKRT